MGLRPLKPCSAPACPALVRGARYCEAHAQPWPRSQSATTINAEATARNEAMDISGGRSGWRFCRAIHCACVVSQKAE